MKKTGKLIHVIIYLKLKMMYTIKSQSKQSFVNTRVMLRTFERLPPSPSVAGSQLSGVCVMQCCYYQCYLLLTLCSISIQ